MPFGGGDCVDDTSTSYNVIKRCLSLSGFMLLAGRVRKPEEAATIQSILEKHFKRTVNPDNLFSEEQLTTQFSE